MAKADKATAVAEITEQFKSSTATVVTEYRGLTVANLAELRRSLSGTATYTVAKNTLVKRAAAEAGIEGLDDLFAGPTAIAFVTGEAVDAAKAIKKFAKDHKALVIKGGYMDGHALTVAEVERIADLESREVLLAKLAGAMKGNHGQGRRAVQRSRIAVRPVGRCAAGEEVRRNRRLSTTRQHQKLGKIHTMAKMSTDDLLDAFKEMTLLELSEFVKKFEEVFEVTAAAPVAVAAAGGAAPAAEAAEEQSEFDVILESGRREEDRRHQGRPRDRLRPGPQGGQGPRRRRPQAAAGEGHQGGRRGGQGQARGRRRDGHRQVGRPRRFRTANPPRIPREPTGFAGDFRYGRQTRCGQTGVRYSDSNHMRDSCGKRVARKDWAWALLSRSRT